MRAVVALVLATGIAACGDNRQQGPTDAPPWQPDAAVADADDTDAPPGAPDADLPDAGPPQTLAETGLCANAACTQISPGILEFAPRWVLWSDTASKHRWIYLPPGTQIDTSDMNVWHFPAGAKLWKEFTRDGIRVETRMYWKQGPDENDWYQVAYVWNQTQDAAVAAPLGEQNANGTQHDVPSRSDCRKCHDRVGGRILGFSALQLDAPAAAGNIDLDYLVTHSLISTPPPGAAIPHFALWPDASPADVAALGYLHANCGHCHNEVSDVFSVCPRIFKLDVGQLASKTTTDTYNTTINRTPSITVQNGTYVVTPHDPDHSALYLHFTANGTERMPPLATEMIDPTGDAILRTWIANMPATP